MLSAQDGRTAANSFVTPREQEEYISLRATISRRGTARVYIFALGAAAWAALTLATLALALPPVATLIPLVALAATFEAVLALHVGVERIGRYLLVVHGDQWERYAGTFGRPAGAIAVDALFTTPFLVAAVLTMIPLLATRPIVQELVVVAGSVLAFIVRVLVGRAGTSRQRGVDEKRFREMRERGNEPNQINS